MDQRRLGSSGLAVSAIGLGCNNFGGRVDEAGTRAVVAAALDLGITLFDTADVYGNQRSEELLGRALGSRRAEVVIATKFGMPMGAGPGQRGGSRRWVMQAVEASLRRLGTDWIDLYQLHAPDPATPIEETLDALADCVRAGKVRYLGCSNFSGWQIADAAWVARDRRQPGFVAAQNELSLLAAGARREVLPACERFGLGVLPYFPLASGLLTGKYRRGEPPPPGTRLAEGGPRAGRALADANLQKVEALRAEADAAGTGLLDVAIGWLLDQPVVASVIAGATRPEQVAANVAAAGWRPDAAQRSRLDELARR